MENKNNLSRDNENIQKKTENDNHSIIRSDNHTQNIYIQIKKNIYI